MLVGSSATSHAIEVVAPPNSPSSGGDTTSIKFHPAGMHAAGLFRMSALGLILTVNGTELMHMPQPTEGILEALTADDAVEMRDVFSSSTFCERKCLPIEESKR
jgi:hypothetical protein